MEDRHVSAVNGQEVARTDFELVNDNAALADDRIIAELLRLQPYNGSTVRKCIIPYAASGPAVRLDVESVAAPPAGPLVLSTAAANASLLINPFRAVVGSRVAPGANVKNHWRDVRSAIALGLTTLRQSVQLPATSANGRWDLIYARVDIDVNLAAETRFIRNVSGSNASFVTVRRRNTVTIGMVQGAENASPVRPALPSDTSTAYYIPIAYVRVVHPHTLTTTLTKFQIYEVAPVVNVASCWGAVSCAPADGQWHPDDFAGQSTVWSAAARPNFFLPPTMVGGEQRLVALSWGTGGQHGTNQTFDVDRSIDWRGRAFMSFIHMSNTNTFAWAAASGADIVPGACGPSVSNKDWMLGQSFIHDGDQLGASGVIANAGVVAFLQPGGFAEMGASSHVTLYVDRTNGWLKCRVSAANPDVKLFLWLMASAQMGNF